MTNITPSPGSGLMPPSLPAAPVRSLHRSSQCTRSCLVLVSVLRGVAVGPIGGVGLVQLVVLVSEFAARRRRRCHDGWSYTSTRPRPVPPPDPARIAVYDPGAKVMAMPDSKVLGRPVRPQ